MTNAVTGAPALRAISVDTADAGLAMADTFDQSSSRRGITRRTNDDPDEDAGAAGPVAPVFRWDRRSLGREARRLLGVQGAALHSSVPAFLVKAFCGRRPSRSGAGAFAVARGASTREIARPSATMRLPALYAQGSRLATTNSALLAANEAPLDNRPLDNWLVWTEGTLQARSSAA